MACYGIASESCRSNAVRCVYSSHICKCMQCIYTHRTHTLTHTHKMLKLLIQIVLDVHVHCVRPQPHVSLLWLHIRWKHEFFGEQNTIYKFIYIVVIVIRVSLCLFSSSSFARSFALSPSPCVSFRSIFIHIVLLPLFYKYAKMMSWATTIQWLNYFAILWVFVSFVCYVVRFVFLASLYHHHHRSLIPIMFAPKCSNVVNTSWWMYACVRESL